MYLPGVRETHKARTFNETRFYSPEFVISRRSTENCVLYFVPTTLQQIPMVFNVMKDVIYTELNRDYLCEEYGLNEWHRRRRTLYYGYCAVFRMGRKLGFASIKDVVSMANCGQFVFVFFYILIAVGQSYAF